MCCCQLCGLGHAGAHIAGAREGPSAELPLVCRCPQLQQLGPQLWLCCVPVLHVHSRLSGCLAAWVETQCRGRGDTLWLLANLAAHAGTALQVC